MFKISQPGYLDFAKTVCYFAWSFSVVLVTDVLKLSSVSGGVWRDYFWYSLSICHNLKFFSVWYDCSLMWQMKPVGEVSFKGDSQITILFLWDKILGGRITHQTYFEMFLVTNNVYCDIKFHYSMAQKTLDFEVLYVQGGNRKVWILVRKQTVNPCAQMPAVSQSKVTYLQALF